MALGTVDAHCGRQLDVTLLGVSLSLGLLLDIIDGHELGTADDIDDDIADGLALGV